MHNPSVIETATGFCMKGRVLFENVVAFRNQGEVAIRNFSKSTGQLIVDLKELQDSDASCLALLLAWMRFAKQKKIKLLFVNAPGSLRRMIGMFGLKKFVVLD